jgi:hypothetical protein
MPGRDTDSNPPSRPIHFERAGSVEAAVFERFIDEFGNVDHEVALYALRRGPDGQLRPDATFTQAELAQYAEVARRVDDWCIQRKRVFASLADADRPPRGGGASGLKSLPAPKHGRGEPLEVHPPRHDAPDPRGLKVHGNLPQSQPGQVHTVNDRRHRER